MRGITPLDNYYDTGIAQKWGISENNLKYNDYIMRFGTEVTRQAIVDFY